MGRQYVHLSADMATAREVGRRKGSQPALQVSACDTRASEVTFYESNERVWLADHVPAEFIAPVG